MKQPFSLYIHVPFCARKCPYCDFNTYAVDRVPEDSYVEALENELRIYAQSPEFSGRGIKTVFFGGGTPSLLSPKAIGRVLDLSASLFGVAADAEVTLEANPSLSSLDRFQGFKAAGINRLSFGAQSFSPQILELLGRDHIAADIVSSVSMASDVGIENQSIDIIFGVPGQTLDDLSRDIEAAVALPIRHVSTYSLTIEPGTPFFQRQERGILKMPPDDVVADMLDWIPSFLDSKGFTRYEISNYAKPGWESRHNVAYWLGDDYLGIGAGAHSFVCFKDPNGRRVEGRRWSNKALPAEYQRSVSQDSPVSWRETLGPSALMFEFFYLGLRRCVGVDVAQFDSLFGTPLGSDYLSVLQELREAGLVQQQGSNLKLSGRGINVSDSVFEQLAGLAAEA